MMMDAPYPVTASLVHILLVEDNDGDAELMREALEDAGDGSVAVHHVENGVQAYEYLGQRRQFHDQPAPDLILLDLNLPVIGGHDILTTLRLDAAFDHTPVVILTSSAREVDTALAKRNGADAYQVKPSLWEDYAPLARRFIALAVKGRKRQR